MDIFTSLADPFVRLLVATLLGMSLGVERAVAQKTAGMRTYALVSMGAALFIVISEIISAQYAGQVGSLDPLRMASQIIVGIGFLGAGLIIFRDSQLSGLTTAAGLWVASGIGMAAGFGLFEIAIFATVLTIFVFTILWYLERKVKLLVHPNGHTNITAVPIFHQNQPIGKEKEAHSENDL